MEQSISNNNSGIRRLKCIDAFRGLALALMLLCDNQGNTDRMYPQLRHAIWNGCTLADIAFPIFIIIMGMVVPYALSRRIAKSVSPLKIIVHIFGRSVGIFALGLFLNGFPLYDLSSIRIFGVLQRIALTYLVVSCVTLVILYAVKNKLIQTAIQLVLALIIITVYYLLLKHVNVPEFGKGILEQNGNLAQYIDMKYLHGHMYTPTYDPEGILGTLPAVGSALFGTVVGQILTFPTDRKMLKFLGLLAFGIITLNLANKATIVIPFNKNLWSSSFVLLTAGIAFSVVAVLYLIMDIVNYEALLKPFMALGRSSIVIYVVSELIRKTLWIIPVVDMVTKDKVNLNVWITTHYIMPWSGNILDSAYFGIVYVVLWMIIMTYFYGKDLQ
ncbi:MAG: DUF5009 domain-containing protein [Desulfosporosinus sp.]|nr:DUF5009 domain-containing protein [Desulfosporosinus sp.]